MSLFWWLPFGSVPEITPADLKDSLGKGGPLIVDVRTPGEFAGGHIQGASRMSIGQLKRALAAGAIEPGREVIAVCLSATRSIPAVRLLRQNGVPNARQLAGGMRAWIGAGLPTTKS